MESSCKSGTGSRSADVTSGSLLLYGTCNNSTLKGEERRQQQQQLLLLDQLALEQISGGEKEVKEKRISKNKEKREKITILEEDKELRKERRQSRKRERAETPLQNVEKRRKSEEKVPKMPNHQNGESLSELHSSREKHHYLREEKSPYARDRSHDKEGRDKHRRSGGDNKRR